jgi:hypothetical protein
MDNPNIKSGQNMEEPRKELDSTWNLPILSVEVFLTTATVYEVISNNRMKNEKLKMYLSIGIDFMQKKTASGWSISLLHSNS